MSDLEVRTLAELRTTVTEGRPPTLAGYAIKTSTLSEPLGGEGARFVERVDPQAVTRALSRRRDLVLLAHHDPARILGRESATTLTVRQDDVGLAFECEPPAAEAGVIESVRRGDLRHMSFGFQTIEDSWDTRVTPPVRTLRDVDIRELSIVTHAAYPDTSVALRSLQRHQEATMSTPAVVAPPVELVPPIAPSVDHDYATEVRKFSLRALLAGAAGLPNVDWAREREVSQEVARRSAKPFSGYAVPLSVLESRVITTALPVGGPGANVIGADYRPAEYIDLLRAALQITRLGARVLSGLVGNVEIPRLKASATAGWVAENTALTPSDPQHEKITLTPRHVGCLAEYSRNLLLQSSPDIEELLRRDFAQVLAAAVDQAAIAGTGGTQPTGILSTVGIGSVTGGATWATAIDLIADVEAANATGTGFLTNPTVVALLRKAVKVATTDSQMVMEGPSTLAGYPVAVTSLVPASTLIFGNFTDLFLGYWSELDLLVNPYDSVAYPKGNVMLRGFISVDVALRHPQSFAAATDLTGV